MQAIKYLVVVFALICAVNSAKILFVFHVAAYSHFSLGDTLAKELAAHGHEITMISPFESKPPVKNYKTILLPEVLEFMKSLKIDPEEMENMSVFESTFFVFHFGSIITELTLNSTNVQKLLKSNEKFDLIVTEQFLNEAHRGFQHHFNAPCVIYSSIGSSSWTNYLVANPSNPSYIPAVISGFSSPLNFLKRMKNLGVNILEQILLELYALPTQNKILHKYFPGAPHIKELLFNTSLILLNSHVSLNQPVPHVPNMIEVGGMHVKPPKKLPEDLQKFLDDAKEGVIYFSLGSNLKSKDLPVEKREAILNNFRKLKMKILWKWEEETMPGQPKNVTFSKWLPQQDILAHPNVKLFITHGGLLSTIETTYHGKPILGIPFYGDQKMNMGVAENNGIGISLAFRDLNEKSFGAALNEVLNNPKYSENAKTRSRIINDQPMKPLDLAVFWVEYVIRHKGAPHFRSTALDLSWYQYLLLDVAAFVILALFVIISVPYLLCKKIFCKTNKAKVKASKKNQ